MGLGTTLMVKFNQELKMNNRTIIHTLFILLSIGIELQAQTAFRYDVVLEGGRVIDPETKLDAIRNVGILNGRIAMISTEPLKGKESINVSGLVVVPGFIDLHVHGMSSQTASYQ